MKRRTTTLLLLLAAVTALGLSWRDRRAARLLAAERAATLDRAAKAKADLDQASRRIAALRHELANAESTSRLSPATAAPAGTPMDWNKWLKDQEAKARDPKVQLRELATARARLHTRYEPLYRRLRWSNEKIAAFENAETRQTEQTSDLFAAIQSQGLSPSAGLQIPAIAAMHSRILSESLAEERAALGEADFTEFREYRRALSARELVRGYASTAVMAGEPLTPTQAEELVRAITSASATYAKGGDVSSLDIDWKQVDQAAARLLTPKQIELLQTSEIPPTGGRLWGDLCFQYSVAVNAESRSR